MQQKQGMDFKMYENNSYLIVLAEDLSFVNFNEVLEDSFETLRYSVDGTKFIINWNGDAPDFILNLQNTDGPYTHQEILQNLESEFWTQEIIY
jgi:hypothetical protein